MKTTISLIRMNTKVKFIERSQYLTGFLFVLSFIISELSIIYYSTETNSDLPVLLYCHTFSGNKTEGLSLLSHVVSKFTLCLFDFRGCGNTTDEFVTLGLREKIDLEIVLNAIDEAIKPKRIYLWGRSMGAVSIIHFLTEFLNKKSKQNKIKINLHNLDNTNTKKIQTQSDPFTLIDNKMEKNKEEFNKKDTNPSNIEKKHVKSNENNIICVSNNDECEVDIKSANLKHKEMPLLIIDSKPQENINTKLEKIDKKIGGLIFDSPFTNSHKMIKDLMTKSMKISSFVSKIVLAVAGKSIKNHVKYDVLGQNKPIDIIKFIKFPALFMIGENDAMVDSIEFQKMFDLCEADHKSLRFLQDTDHSDFRKATDIDFAINFLLTIEEK